MEVKKTFEEPKVEKVEFDFKTRIAASLCSEYDDPGFAFNTEDCTMEPW